MRTADRVSRKRGSPKTNRSTFRPFFGKKDMPTKLLILDSDLVRELILEREKRGIDSYDEVWEGVYIVPPLANLPHQQVVSWMTGILFNAITLEGRGQVYPGANVSDRRHGWKSKFRAPDVVVVLNESRAVDCTTHLLDGPDF